MSDNIYNHSQLDLPDGEILKQKVITYLKIDGKITKITVNRDFYEGDYVDSMLSEVIYTLE